MLQQQFVDDDAAHALPGRGKAPITQYLGMDPTEVKMVPHTGKEKISIGERYLVCSDGLKDMLSSIGISEITASNDSSEKVDYLIAKAMINVGRDNVTVIIRDICQV